MAGERRVAWLVVRPSPPPHARLLPPSPHLKHPPSRPICQLIEHLPHSVNGVGEELARGDPDLEPFYAVGKVKPSELLGFVVVGWMLEGSGHSGAHDEERWGAAAFGEGRL